jgi:cyclophilin family peptidyl-prolyl cis-trans isomerase
LKKYIYLLLLVIVVILGTGFFFILRENKFEVGGDSKISFETENSVRDKTEGEGLENIEVKKEMIATIKTNFGEIELEFFTDKAPKTVENFLKLAESGFYDGTKFHRVISGFMIQGGDPLSSDDEKKDLWGTGGPGYTFADEIYDGNSNSFGTISMANSGPNTNGSQFFINTADNNFLDSKHTVFGRVINGIENVRGIENIETSDSDRPVKSIVINSIIILKN